MTIWYISARQHGKAKQNIDKYMLGSFFVCLFALYIVSRVIRPIQKKNLRAKQEKDNNNSSGCSHNLAHSRFFSYFLFIWRGLTCRPTKNAYNEDDDDNNSLFWLLLSSLFRVYHFVTASFVNCPPHHSIQNMKKTKSSAFSFYIKEDPSNLSVKEYSVNTGCAWHAAAAGFLRDSRAARHGALVCVVVVVVVAVCVSRFYIFFFFFAYCTTLSPLQYHLQR